MVGNWENLGGYWGLDEEGKQAVKDAWKWLHSNFRTQFDDLLNSVTTAMDFYLLVEEKKGQSQNQ